MREPIREFVFDTSAVVFGSALAIHGLVGDKPLLTTTGLGVLAVVFALAIVEVRVRERKRPPSARLRRVAYAFLRIFDRQRARPFVVVGFAVSSVAWAVRCIVAAVARDWGDCLYYGVIAAAGTAAAITEHASPSEDGHHEASAADAALRTSVDVP